MVALLASCVAAVVAARAIGGASEGAVVRLGSGPDRGRFVAALATRSRCKVTSRLAGGYCAVVTAGAARADCHIDVELRWCPGRVALVSCSAVGCRADVVGTLASSVGAVVAACAIGGCSEGAVVRLGAGPCGIGLVAALTARCRG